MKKIVMMAMMMATGLSATAQDEIETTISADILRELTKWINIVE